MLGIGSELYYLAILERLSPIIPRNKKETDYG
jgi:hypothetical protein